MIVFLSICVTALLLCNSQAARTYNSNATVAVAMLMGLGGETTSKGVVDMCGKVNKKVLCVCRSFAPSVLAPSLMRLGGLKAGEECKYWHWNQWTDAGNWLKKVIKFCLFVSQRRIFGGCETF